MGSDESIEEEKSKSLDILAKHLYEMLMYDVIKSSDSILEVTMKASDGVRIELHTRDHNPPNFHVKYGDRSAVYNVNNGEMMRGNLPPRANRIVKDWYTANRDTVIDTWNKTRPGIIAIGESCMVGPN